MAPRLGSRFGSKKQRQAKVGRSQVVELRMPRDLKLLLATPNPLDATVVAILTEAKHGSLKVDHFSYLLGAKSEKSIEKLRDALVRVYCDASRTRSASKASAKQIRMANASRNALARAIQNLAFVKPLKQRGLKAMFIPPSDDPRGNDELNDFARSCSQIRLDAVRLSERLDRVVENEDARPDRVGDRKRRLRTLIDALAMWWLSAIRRPLHRKGAFLDLACALFCKIDCFRDSEVASALSNVYDSELVKRARAASA